MLSAAKVKAIKPGSREVEIDDGKIPGLKLRVLPSGVKSWCFRYRFDGGQRRVTLGHYPGMKLAGARQEASGILEAVEHGRDPSAEQATDRQAMRMVDLLGVTDPSNKREDKRPGWYLETYCASAGKLGPAKTPAVVRSDRARIVKHLRTRKALMRKRVDAVTLAEIKAIKAGLPAGTWAKVRAILVTCFKHAEEVGALAPGTNPAARTKAPKGQAKERFLSPEERQRMEAALTRAEQLGAAMEGTSRGDSGGLSPHLVRALRLLALTGMRRAEVVGLQWQWIDWRHAQIRLPTSKTGARIVPLTPQALRYLKREKGKGARIGLVCPTTEGTPLDPSHVTRAWRRVRKAAELDGRDGKPAVRLHDLRHSWASDAISAGVPLYVVGRALGHSQATTTQRYAHLHDSAIKDGLRLAGAAIEKATRGK